MPGYVVYDTLQDEDASHPRKVRVDKHDSLEEAKRSAQMRYIRSARPHQAGEPAVARITVETSQGEIVYELPELTSARPQAAPALYA